MCVLPPSSLLPGHVGRVVEATVELIGSQWKVACPKQDYMLKCENKLLEFFVF